MQNLARSSSLPPPPSAPAQSIPTPSTPEPSTPVPFYAPHQKIYPKAARGRFRRIKSALMVGLLALFMLLPWLRWDRGAGLPNQAILFDLDSQRFYLFALELWPQHIYYLTGAMILAAVGLFLATALAGRVWCGYTCPQTVWTDLYVKVEEWIEGDRGARIRLDKGPRNANWLARKTAKHAVWLLIALATGASALFYFVDAPGYVADLLRFQPGPVATGWILFMTACTYAMAGFMREQMCVYVCPWPRIQAALLDDESLTVTYQDWRGDGRAPLRKEQSWAERSAEGLGDCIDCKACVQVCPTGIDIRDGLQMDCISCGLCIDACDDVMGRVGRPGGLIRYDTQAAQEAKAVARKPEPYRLVRPRTIIYSLVMLVVGGMMTIGVLLEPTVDVSVLRDRAPLYVTLSDGAIQNSYTVKISNMTRAPQGYRLTVSGPRGATVTAVGGGAVGSGAAGGAAPVLGAEPDTVQTHRIHVRAPAGAAVAGPMPLTLTLTRLSDGVVHQTETVFLAP